MGRIVNILLVLLMVMAAAAVYDMKYEAELAAEKVAELEREIAGEQAAISILKAEWSTLTQPARLQELVERHADILTLQPLSANHIGTLADIPQKPVEVPADAGPTAEDATGPDAPAEVETGAVTDDELPAILDE